MTNSEKSLEIKTPVGTDVSRPRWRSSGVQGGRDTSVPTPWLFMVIGIVLFVAALWSYMLITASTHETLDQHAQRIASQLKCPVCQGESVADAPVELAQQMRGIIREKLQAGESDQQIIQFFIDRYGQQIVWSPPWWGFSLLAWLAPIVLVTGGVFLLFFTLRDWRGASRLRLKQENTELTDMDDDELARYRVQLERELAAEDVLFDQSTRIRRDGRTEAQ